MELLNTLQNIAVLCTAFAVLFMALMDPDRVTSTGKLTIMGTLYTSTTTAAVIALIQLWG